MNIKIHINAKPLLLGLCIVIIGTLNAQDDLYFFNRIGQLPTSYERVEFVSQWDSTFLLIGASQAVFAAKNEKLTAVYDLEGNELSQTVYEEDSASISSGWFGVHFIDDNSIIGAGAYRHYEYEIDPYIFKMNKQGEVQWLKVIARDSFNYFSQGKKALDGNYIFAGVSDEFDRYGDIYLVKTDTTGEVLWERTYGKSGFRDYGMAVQVCEDGGYLIGGDSDQEGSHSGFLNYGDGFVLKTDSVGNEQWYREWGGPMNENIWNIETTTDGGILASGSWSEGDQWTPKKYAYLRKLNNSGELIWEAVFKGDEYGKTPAFLMSRALANGNIIAVGGGYKAINDSITRNSPWAMILDADGNLLMQRAYLSLLGGVPSTTDYTSSAVFQDIRPTSDGGFIAAGTYYPGVGDTGNQDMFIVKLDSAGCEYPGCQPPLGVREDIGVQIIMNPLHLWPNPASDVLMAETAEGIERIDILDAKGTVVLNHTVGAANTKTTRVELDINALSAGTYVVRCQSKIGVKTGKFVKQQ